MKVRKVYFSCKIAALAMCIFWQAHPLSRAAEVSVDAAKDAIVEVQAGLGDYNGNFYPVKNSSGFVVYNQTDGAYVITTNHTTAISDRERERTCKKLKIDSDSSGLSVRIRVIVESDVATDVDVKVNSKKDDFCVLAADDVLKKKSALHLDSNGERKVGDKVYALGYSADAVQKGEYTSNDVEIHYGEIQNGKAKVSGNAYIQHSATVMPEQSGGPLLNESGYLIGMCNSKIVNKSIDVYYALPISKIKTILDNYGIAYESKDKDEAFSVLKETYDRCKGKLDGSGYKRDSTEALTAAIEEADALFSQNSYTINEINEIQGTLSAAEKDLVSKTPKIIIIKYALLAVLVLSAAWSVRKILVYRKLIKTTDPGEGSVGHRAAKAQAAEDFGEKTEAMETPDEPVSMAHKKKSIVGRAFEPGKAFLKNQITGEEINISKADFSIGKNPANDFVIEKNIISRRHAAIEWSDGEYYIADCESSNGTFVNGRKIERETVHLSNRDLITFADVEYIFVIRGDQ